MIEVILCNGDRAECDTPEEAVFAALTIAREAQRHVGIQGYDPDIRFMVDGKPVRSTSLSADLTDRLLRIRTRTDIAADLTPVVTIHADEPVRVIFNGRVLDTFVP